jgi:ligand-binding sensor domain-containing protein
LVQIHERRVDVITTSHGLNDRATFAVLQDSAGAFWVGSTRERLDRIGPTGEVTHYELGEGRITRPISALCEDRDGLIWTATRDGSVFRQSGDGTFSPMFTASSGITKVFAIVKDRDGNLWFGGRNGIARWNGSEVVRFDGSKGAPSHDVTALTFDVAGTLWVGTERGEIFQAADDRFELVGSVTSPGQRPVSALHPDEDGSLWITTLGGGSSICEMVECFGSIPMRGCRICGLSACSATGPATCGSAHSAEFSA